MRGPAFLVLGFLTACSTNDVIAESAPDIDRGALDAGNDASGREHAPLPEAAVPPSSTLDSGVPAFPPLFPTPKIPAENPLTTAKAKLGRHLFYDARLSANQTQSCASCHQQKLAFTDGRAHGVGSTGQQHPRGALSLANVAYASTLTWMNPLMTQLERQALVPMFGETPVELGMSGHEDDLVTRLKEEPRYAALFAAAFPGDSDPVTVLNVTYAIASFERTLQSAGSPYDRYLAGSRSALGASELRGMDVFFSEKTECFHCHGDFALSDSTTFEGKAFDEAEFHNTGLYNIGGNGAYPAPSQGLIEFTKKASDMGRFKAPTLRNIAVTAPYMHDGSVATLDDVLDHYAAGGRTITSGASAGVGSKNPYKSELVTGFTLTAGERTDLLAFLAALTDDEFLEDPRFADPWE
jgi:cytochrome c peroxidase